MANGGMFVLGNFYVSFCQGFQKEQGHWGQGRGTMKEGATQVVVEYVEIFCSYSMGKPGRDYVDPR